MMSNVKIGVALVGGYVLGRTKKAKLAIGLGMYLAGKRLNLDPRQLGKLVANSPVLGPLNDQVRSELVDATKSAATSALTQRMSALTDSLHERTLELSDAGSDTGRGAESADEPGNAEHPDSEDEQPEDAEDEQPAPSGKRAATSSARSSKPAASKSSAKTSAAKTSQRAKSAKAATSGTSATDKATHRAGKTASGARKATTGTRKKAAGTARSTADRGGRDA